ncbi:MAG: DUF58 domain-containing protein [Paracoccaceae bacterium]
MTAGADPVPSITLRHDAEGLASAYPALLADARRLAQAVHPGLHGRRRVGQGAEFWQYRDARPGDEARHVDWRRSARSDQHYLRELEWQAAQTVQFWADGAASMSYRSAAGLPAKAARARLLAMALAVLLERGGERIGLADGRVPPRAGAAQLLRMAEGLTADVAAADYGTPAASGLVAQGHAVFLSDFFGDHAALSATVLSAADKGVEGLLVQVLDPTEVSFPFAGRAIFQSMGNGLRHETKEAAALGPRYLERLAARQDALVALAQKTGWHYFRHQTDQPAQQALLWLFQAMERKR